MDYTRSRNVARHDRVSYGRDIRRVIAPFKARRFRTASFPIQTRTVILKTRVAARRMTNMKRAFYAGTDTDFSGSQRLVCITNTN